MPIRRYEMTDSQWEQIKHLFLVAKTRRPAMDNHMMFNAILWITRSGSAWRDLPNAMVRRKPFTAVLEWLSNQQLNKPSGASATTQQLKLLEM